MDLPPWRIMFDKALSTAASPCKCGYIDRIDKTVFSFLVNDRPCSQILPFHGILNIDDYPILSKKSSDSNLSAQSTPSIHESLWNTHNRSSSYSSTQTKMNNLLMFPIDIRNNFSLSIESGKNNFVDTIWLFSDVEIRLSGRIHLVCDECSPLKQSVLPVWAPKRFPWEQERIKLWNSLDSASRAKLTGGIPGSSMLQLPRVDRLPSFVEDKEELQLNVHETTEQQQLMNLHDEALAHFGIVLLDVDTAEIIGADPSRILFELKTPERTYGRGIGMEWTETVLNP